MQRTRRRWDDDPGVADPIQQSSDLDLTRCFLEDKIDLRAALGERSHECWKDVVIGNTDERQFQPSDLTAMQALRGFSQKRQDAESFANVFQPWFAERRQRDGSFGPDEERCAKLTLQRHDGLTQRGLRHIQSDGRPVEVQRFSHSHKLSKLSDVHS